MPNDVITLNAVVNELNNTLLNARIDKIYQPEIDELNLTLKAGGKHYKLVISSNVNFPNIRLTTIKKQNPLVASPFCMLLRKHLAGGIIESICLHSNDRIIKIAIQNKNEMGDKVKFYLLSELIGRYSNIILAKDDMTIVDAIKRVPFDLTDNAVLPNLKYQKSPQNKLRLDQSKKIKELFEKEQNVDMAFIISNISGISKDTANEILQRKSESYSNIINNFFNIYNTPLYKPCLRYDENNILKDYYITPYISQKGKYVYLDTINECLDAYYSRVDTVNRKKTNTRQLNKLLKRLKSKFQKRESDYQNKIEESKKAHIYKEYGELILSNMHKTKKGDKVLKCINFYDNSQVEIELDQKLFPHQNAQKYFKKHHKLKKAKEIAFEQLKIIKKQKKYLESIEIALENSSEKQEYKEIHEELLTLGNLKKPQKNKKLKEQPSKPARLNIDGMDIYIGKNNLQNEKVTFEIGASNDIWLHAKGYHGAHVIIKSPNPSQEILTKAAEISAFYSQAKNADKVEVDYTQRKNVKRQKGGMIGMVDYKNYKTIVVTPNDFEE